LEKSLFSCVKEKGQKMKAKTGEAKIEAEDTPVFDAAYFDGGKGVPKVIPVICDWCQQKRAKIKYRGYFLCEKCAKNEARR
jgi:hypothetical protein